MSDRQLRAINRRRCLVVAVLLLVLSFSIAGVLQRKDAVAAERAPDVSASVSSDEDDLTAGLLLGKRLFEDPDLSEPRGVSCASCHDARTAFRGNNHSDIASIAAGSRPGQFGIRKTPSILYMSYSPPFSFAQRKNDVTGALEIVPVGGQFWDGHASDLQDQVSGPLLNPREMNNPSKQAVIDKVRNGKYADLVRTVYGPGIFDDPAVFDKLASAIASFEASARFKPFSSKFDDWLEGKLLLNDKEWRGFQLFTDPNKGNCISCHDGGTPTSAENTEGFDPTAGRSRNPRDWLFTDFTYDAIGTPRNADIPDNADPSYFDLGLCRRPDLKSVAPENFDIESLCGAFKVPTLRNVAINGPYMHNGYFRTLRDAVRFYFTRDTSASDWYPKSSDGSVTKFNDLPERYRGNVNTRQAPYDRKMGEMPRATDDEIDCIVAFLETLTDRPFATLNTQACSDAPSSVH